MHRPTAWSRPLLVLVVSLGLASGAVRTARGADAPAIRTDAALRARVEDQGRRYVEALGSDDATQRARAVRELFAPATLAEVGEARLLGQLDRVRADLGALALHHAEAIVAGADAGLRASLHVYARTKDGRWKDLQFMLEPAPPHRLTRLLFIAEVTEPVYLPNGEITSPATLEWLDRYIDGLATREGLAGSLLVAAGDRVIVERTFGFADSAGRRPVGPHTRFNLASGGKMFTALLVAQLVEQGRVRWGDTLSRHLPELAAHPSVGRVTLAQLLSHTSGVGEYWTAEYERHWNDLRRLHDHLPFVLKAGTGAAPGERFGYSNSNFILLGLVIEAVTGRAYDEVLRERILDPLGMRATGLDPFDDADTLQAARLARGPDGWRNTPHGYRGTSAGGCLTTAADMMRFARGLAGGRIVATATLAEMTTSRTSGLPDSPMDYGYGFILERTAGGVRSWGHGGIASGVNFEFRHFPDLDITLIGFSNQDSGAYDDLRKNTLRLITGER